MFKNDEIISNVYIPETHKKYNVLKNHRIYNEEMFVWNEALLRNIEEHTNMVNTYPYYRYKTYQDFYQVINEWLIKYPEIKKEILNFKNSIIKLNNKDLWGIVKYIGKSNFGFTQNDYYYVVMYKENNCWKIDGIIDNEEYNSFPVWLPGNTNQVNLLKDLKIIIDPSNNLKNEFMKIMNKL